MKTGGIKTVGEVIRTVVRRRSVKDLADRFHVFDVNPLRMNLRP